MLCLLVAGCSVIDTGPKTAQIAVEGAAATAKVLLAQYKPETMTAGAKANINDPRYRVRVFVGAGTLCDMFISLEGADAGFNIQGAGGASEISAELKAELSDIIGNQAMSTEERWNAVLDALTKHFIASPPDAGSGTGD
jgi:hypothetical protein